MEAYTGFAQVYDTFMDNVPYDNWVKYLHQLLKEYGVDSGLVLDLGCGTGNVSRRLKSLGYDIIGLDSSIQMLEIARQKDESESILYINQDMREFELYGTVAAVVSICDSMNYITSEDELLEVFKLVNNYLDSAGIFIFDMDTKYKYESVLAYNVIAEDRDDCSFIWSNYYYEEEQINESNITIFTNKDGDTFERFREMHFQKAYSVETIIDLLEKANMEFLAVYDAFTHKPPRNESERVYFIARERHQENKTYI